MGLPDYEHVHVESRAQLRAWLEANADRTQGIWLVTWRTPTGRPAPSYDDIVEEALCFGWIDSTIRTLDDERNALLFTPRKPRSVWSAVNKERLTRLLGTPLMTERGLRAIEVAKQNGSWELLDSVERLEVPDELGEALDSAGLRQTWETFPKSARKQMIWSVISAKREITRQARVQQIIDAAAEGNRALG